MTAVWLPGYVDGGSPVASVFASLEKALGKAPASKSEESVTLYYYSVSVAGWRKIAPLLEKWRGKRARRKVRAYVGTDHGFTDPAALLEMQAARVELFLLSNYEGVYHPKVILWQHENGGSSWIGSHNLSVAAFERNIEFGALLSFKEIPAPLKAWCKFIEGASEFASDALLQSYNNEREKFAKKQASAQKFIWSKRTKPKKTLKLNLIDLPDGVLVMEITPRETGAGGKQIQPPIPTLTSFFGLPATQITKNILAKLKGSPSSHSLTLTRMANSTARLHIAELDYLHRPCFIVFEKVGKRFEYEIVTQEDTPIRYQQINSLNLHQTRKGSRRWAIHKKK